MKGARVGQAVADFSTKEALPMTCGELLEGFSAEFIKEFEKTINDNLGKFKDPFYILVLTKKEFWAENVIRNWFIPRQTAPYASNLMIEYPNHTKTLYIIDGTKGDLKVAWSIPAYQDCLSILKNPFIYSQELVKWIVDCFNKKLDIDNYQYLFE